MKEVFGFTTGIKKLLESKLDSRDPSVISMSAIGHCARQLAYRVHCVSGTPLTWRSQMIFNDGDMAHNQLRGMLAKSLIEQQSCYRLVKEEFDTEFEGVSGHIDGVLEHSATCQGTGPEHKTLLLEVKSMNDRGFSELRKTGELPWEYRCQVSGYLAGMNLDEALILVKNKNNGDLLEYRYSIEHDILISRMQVVERIAASECPEEVARDYVPNNRGNLPWQCNYCPFVRTCWNEFEPTEHREKRWSINTKLYKAWQAMNEEPANDQEAATSAT